MPGMTRCGWPAAWLTCRCRYWAGCAATGSCASRRSGAPGRGRPPRHGSEFKLADPATWPQPPVATTTQTTRYGTASAQAWDRLHPRLTHRSAWLEHNGPLPVIEGTLIRLQVDHLPGDRNPKPVWLWCSAAGTPPDEVDRYWQAFLRRFDIEHTFRLFKQVLGWTAPKIRDPHAADRWTSLILTGHAHPRPGPPGMPKLPPARPLPSRCTETRQTRPRTPARIQEPASGTPLRRRENNQEGTRAQGQARTSRLKNKLRGSRPAGQGR